MADTDYVRLAAVCHCGKPANVALGRGRPPKQCEEHLSAQARAPRPHKPAAKVAICEKCAATIERGKGGRIPRLCAACKPPPRLPKPQRQCPACRGFFVPRHDGQRACSKPCGRRFRLGRTKRENHAVNCSVCGNRFESLISTAMYCSTRCKTEAWERANPERAKELQQAHAARRDKRIKSCIREAVLWRKVFERDGWRCKLCGISTPRELRGTYEHNAPELDHVIPVSRGGPHTYANTQCLCRSCNGWKRARTMEEALADLAA